MLPAAIPQLLQTYRDGLLNDTLPFWIPRAIDRESGGYITSLDRDGTILHTDKPVWFQGRFAWLLATLYNTVERRPEWLELARHGIRLPERALLRPRWPDVLFRHAGRPAAAEASLLVFRGVCRRSPWRPTELRPKTTAPGSRPWSCFG